MLGIFDISRQEAADYFWPRVRRGPGCWAWAGTVTKKGYGQACIHGHAIRAHRLSYLVNYGPIPSGLIICHHCDNPLCVRPDHLFLGTNKDNTQDMMDKGRAGGLGDRHWRRRHPERYDPISTPRGGSHWAAKLSDEQVVQVRQCYADGSTNAELAARFEVSPACISMIVRGKRWRHADGPIDQNGGSR